MTESRRKEWLFDEQKFLFIMRAPFNESIMADFIQSEIERNRKDAISGVMKYLHRLEIGGEMFCLICSEGNDGEIPEHKENCELKAFIAALKDRGIA